MDTQQRIRELQRHFPDRTVAAILDIDHSEVVAYSRDPAEVPVVSSGGFVGKVYATEVTGPGPYVVQHNLDTERVGVVVAFLDATGQGAINGPLWQVVDENTVEVSDEADVPNPGESYLIFVFGAW